jgi:hypothetical protein
MATSVAGDAPWVMRAAERRIAAGADRSGVAQEHYIRLDWHWARALTGDDPAGEAAEAERLLAATLLDPPRRGIAYHYGLIAEMWLAADLPDAAATALDRAQPGPHHVRPTFRRRAPAVAARAPAARPRRTRRRRASRGRGSPRPIRRTRGHLFARRAAELIK